MRWVLANPAFQMTFLPSITFKEPNITKGTLIVIFRITGRASILHELRIFIFISIGAFCTPTFLQDVALEALQTFVLLTAFATILGGICRAAFAALIARSVPIESCLTNQAHMLLIKL